MLYQRIRQVKKSMAKMFFEHKEPYASLELTIDQIWQLTPLLWTRVVKWIVQSWSL